jgi:diketogulonate reductase-like aldo/keto reductase
LDKLRDDVLRIGAQIALRWLVQQNITAVTAAHNPAYIAEDISAYCTLLLATVFDCLLLPA